LVQAIGLDQTPRASQVATPLPTQLVLAGVHTPVQTPSWQAWPKQGIALDQLPLASQVSTPLPTHLVVPGVQLPTHAPS
jgi:hypothetical protein